MGLMLFALCFGVRAQGNEFNSTGFEAISFTSQTCSGFFGTSTWRCEETRVPAYMLKAKDRRAVVFISHGSQGLDKRHGDYAKALVESGITAVVLGHWQARGLGPIQMNYDSGRNAGGNTTSQVIDVLSAATQLKETAEFKDARMGQIGESMGGSTALNLTRPYLRRAFNEIYGKPPVELSALVALYPGCFDHFSNEAFRPTPLLFIVGSEDDDTPAADCIEQVPYIKSRGGNASIIVLQGEGHDFDAPFRQQRSKLAQNPQKCWNNRDGDTFILRASGKKYPGTVEGYNALMKDCIAMTWAKPTVGYRESPRTGYKEWTAYLRRELLDE